MLLEIDLVTINPARDVAMLSVASEGFHTWSLNEVRAYIKRHPFGSNAYLALCLPLFAGSRRSDAVAFRRQHLQGGWLRYTQHKGQNAKPMTPEGARAPRRFYEPRRFYAGPRFHRRHW